MSNESTNPHQPFLRFLYGLSHAENRGALAHLRRGVGKEFPSPEALRLIAEYFPRGERGRVHEAYELVAGLFALHPELGGRGNLGDSFRQLGDNESAQKRFVALLDSNREDLPYRLRQAVSLAKSKDARINWEQLLSDILDWEHPKKIVQYRWARAYWGHQKKEEPTLPDNQPASAGQQGDV